jgi:hypothetical protein
VFVSTKISTSGISAALYCTRRSNIEGSIRRDLFEAVERHEGVQDTCIQGLSTKLPIRFGARERDGLTSGNVNSKLYLAEVSDRVLPCKLMNHSRAYVVIELGISSKSIMMLCRMPP